MDLVKLRDEIEALPKEKHISLVRMIVKEYGIYPDENMNGCFINLSTLPQNVIRAIEAWTLLVEK